MENIIIWSPLTVHAAGDKGLLGKWKIFEVWYSGITKIKNTSCKLNCYLPGIKSDVGSFGSEECAKEYADKILKRWVSKSKILCLKTKKEI